MHVQCFRSGVAAFFLLTCVLTGSRLDAQILIGHGSTDLVLVPSESIARAATDLFVAYNHTSHGSQIVSGMNALRSFPDFGTTYDWSEDGSQGLYLDDRGIPCSVPDLSQGDFIDQHGVTPWVTCTRDFLNDPGNSHINVIMWSWCSINNHDAQRYVDNMEILVSEYPDVDFVFMTGHAQGHGEDLTPNGVHFNNELIREHCRDNRRILFDFADIEAYDPDGEYYWDRNLRDNLDYDGGNWAQEWITENPGSELARLTTGDGATGYDGCGACAHSDSPSAAKLNCVLKGRATWWMFAQLAGWQPVSGPRSRQTSGKRLIPDGAKMGGASSHNLVSSR